MTDKKHSFIFNVRFTAPNARILIVDDMPTNLSVAKGLLSLYKVQIDTATGGKEAIALVEQNRYDLVFMDHMMPEMDGVEAVKIIRTLPGNVGAHIPVIALTANAVSGMKEMSPDKGFDDYLAKPIEISKLDKIMNKWIRPDKKVKEAGKERGQADKNGVASFAKLSELDKFGVDAAKGVMMTGGTMEGYRRVLALFVRDAEERLEAFQPLLETPAPLDEAALSAFSISVHALKTASGTIGADALSDEAKQLEEAGKANDVSLIQKNLTTFCAHLKEIIGALTVQISKNGLAPGGKMPAVSAETYHDQFAELAAALADEDIGNIDRLLAELEHIQFDVHIKKLLADVSDAVLMGEFTAGIKILEDLIHGE
jgi:CheY-like chemotaxis protein